MFVPIAPRCPVCAARDWRDDAQAPHRGRRCGHCGLRVPGADVDPVRTRRALDALLRPGSVDAGLFVQDLRMDAYTLRTAASACGLGFEPADGAQADALARPHSELPGRGRLTPFAEASARVTLGIIARDAARALEHVARWSDRFAGAIVLQDAPSDGLPRTAVDDAEIVRHPLGGDFGAQRNRVQALASTPWVLQLDTDETPDDALLRTMNALTVQADAQGVVSIGLPRSNVVDGALSDLYPDVQYRLNRREVRYAGRVHERPDLAGEWWRSMIAPGATLTHRLERARVLARSVRYEAMTEGGGRSDDEAALLRAFRD